MLNIHVSFWEKLDGGETEVFSFTSSSYPTYIKGENIWLEFTCHPLVPEKFKKESKRAEEYTITKIAHSVRQSLSDQPTIDTIGEDTFKIPFSFHTYASIDIYVQKTLKTNDEK